MTETEKTLSFVKLAHCPDQRVLGLDNYQRGFVWEPRRVRQLVTDLAEYAASLQQGVSRFSEGQGTDQRPFAHAYYMGIVLLHRPDDPVTSSEENVASVTHYVIDGQQRLAALGLLWAALSNWRGDIGHAADSSITPGGMAFHYSQKTSQNNLQHAYIAAHETLKLHQGGDGRQYGNLLQEAEIFSKIALTKVETSQEDEAFAFFDSQNTRGVPLQTTDLLKAHHLRAIRVHCSDDEEERSRIETLERDSATRWERLQQFGKSTPTGYHGTDFANRLFNRYLWRSRQWTGLQCPSESRQRLLAEFRDEAYPPKELINRLGGRPPESPRYHEQRDLRGNIDQVACFPPGTRVLHPTVCWSLRRDTWEVDLHLPHQSSDPALLPFSIRQPLSEGAGFFLYAERYGTLLRELETEPKDEVAVTSEIEQFRHFYQKVIRGSLTTYLQQPFLLASLLYLDRFEECRLLEFALWLDHVIGAERLQKQAVHGTSISQVLGPDQERPNLLDVITNSVIPDTVIRTLREIPGIDESYQKLDKEHGIQYRGIQAQRSYAGALRSYYGRRDDEPLIHKRQWIADKLASARACRIAKEVHHG